MNFQFEDNFFDLVHCLGSMLQLYNLKDKDRAISEIIRVCKPKGICVFAYLTRSYMVWTYGVRKGKLVNIDALNSDGSIKIFQKKYLVPTLLKIFKNNLENRHNIFKEYCKGWTCSYKEIILTTTKSPTKI